ncbi:tRNA (guanosine(37)-N1)-methyltransferase TrmD [Fodinisporobacter ferrooxydans]|uniref:tRNA (guanine-N(1)-)-methyltransferase n=1 Tax=Fodinisporobacter ferrooxydans TaxID=2901836 RepID=A0ABY4CQV7_9BACL|nr:tRNA (guanosine(37)-N1)-methyltransferase TrmD [Alicyclobacillaceae bacterium MYW30-H2]
MKIDILTLFPAMFSHVLGDSILGRAAEQQLVQFRTVDFRKFSTNKHQTVDDTPYGGGGGMVLKPDPIFHAVESMLSESEMNSTDSSGSSADSKPRVILMCPQGELFRQKKAIELSREQHLIFICGHYEGYDERIRRYLITDEISIGDYVLTGGEIPAMAVIDAVVRLLPGVLGNQTSAWTDSFSDGLLEYPHYTRPADFRGWKVPDVLLSGNHAEIEKWRRRQSLLRTLQKRPELLEQADLSEEERRWLAQRKWE